MARSIDELRRRGRDVRAEYYRQLENVRSDRELSAEGKKTRITAAWRKAASETKQLQQELRESRETRRRELQQRVFGPLYPRFANETERQMAQLNFRDALDRADRVTNDEQATRLLERAERSGDTALARAIAAVAAERGYATTLDTYLATRPDDAETVRELSELTPSAQEHFTERMTFSIERPPEVGYNEPVETPAGTAA